MSASQFPNAGHAWAVAGSHDGSLGYLLTAYFSCFRGRTSLAETTFGL